MEFFNSAKTVKLKSYHGKYLFADDNKENVQQSRSGSSRNARWEVEFVKGKSDVIRLKSFHGRYLTPSAEPFLLGMTGEKVIQTVTPTTAVEWKPITSGSAVQLVTAGGQFLRANWGLPPWRNSVTHSVPLREMTQDWILWKVEVVDVLTSPHSSSHARTPASTSTSAPTQARQRSSAPARARQRPNGTTKANVNRQQGQSNAGGDNTSSDSESVKGSNNFSEIDCVVQGFSEIDVVQGGVSAAISYEDDDDNVEDEDEDENEEEDEEDDEDEDDEDDE